MGALEGLLWGALLGGAVSLGAEFLIAASATPAAVLRPCLDAQGRLTQPRWRCWLLTWRHGGQALRTRWRSRAFWRQPRAWGPVVLLALLGHWLAQGGAAWGAGALLLTGAYFALVAVVDAETHLVPYEAALLGLGLGLAVGLPRHGWLSTLGGVVGGTAIMALFYWVGERYAYWQARRSGQQAPEEPALGFGDVYLSGVLGAFLGWPGVVAALVLGSFLMGGFILALGAVMLLQRRNLAGLGGRYLPMAPFLVLAALWLILTA